jgi:hypothetical protein
MIVLLTIVVGAAVVGLAFLLFLIAGAPVGTRVARAGLRYRVRSTEHIVPELQLPTPRPRLIREPVLDKMARLLEYGDALFAEHGINYWISCGTLLGSMRHKGFIPWDDDIDVQIELSDRARLLALVPRLKQDGFVLLEAAGGFKLAHANFWRFPYIDLVMVDRVDGVFKLCYPLNAEGQATFAKARQWPNECLPIEDVFPLARVPFEDFTVWAPRKTLGAAQAMYGERSLKEVRHSTRYIPWVLNHRTNGLLFKLGLIGG